MNPIPIPEALQRMANSVKEHVVEIVHVTSGGAMVARTTWMDGSEFTTPLSLFVPLDDGGWTGWDLPKAGGVLSWPYHRLDSALRKSVTPEEHELINNLVSLL